MRDRLPGLESIKHLSTNGEEYWLASELALLLDYRDEQNFKTTIQQAMISCEQSGFSVHEHFVNIYKTAHTAGREPREIEDCALSRLGCYLILQNADPSDSLSIGLAQAYLAMQTRRQELLNESAAANHAGVITASDFAIFQDHGYMGLYGGLRAKDIHARKGLKPSQKILDYMGSTELAANLFRATQAEEQIRREDIKKKEQANQAHYKVGRKVRQTIEELGGTMPEDLPTPKKSIQQIQREDQKRLQQESQQHLLPPEE